MTRSMRPLIAHAACALALALAAAALVAQSSAASGAGAQERQCAGTASWTRVSEGMSVYGDGYASFRVEFPAPTAACSSYFAAAEMNGNYWHGGTPAGNGPYTMSIGCNTTMKWWAELPWTCRSGSLFTGTMESATGATTLYGVETSYWRGGESVAFGPRILPTGSGQFFPARWTSTFALTGEYTLVY